MSRRWSVLVVEAPHGLEEEVAAALADSGLGAEIRPPSGGVAEVRIYLEDGADVRGWEARAARVLDAHGSSPARVRTEILEDGRWVEAYQKALRPIPLGKRFVILPGERLEPIPGREPLVLVPGMAFGTGEHETTRMCAEVLEESVVPGSTWLDLGTGTAILGLIAWRCGARRVLAVDTDPEAVRVAREVVRRNGGIGSVEVREGSTDARGSETFDGVVANIAASFFLREAANLAACVRPGGLVLATGFLGEDVPEIEHALARTGLAPEERHESAPWALIRARRQSG